MASCDPDEFIPLAKAKVKGVPDSSVEVAENIAAIDFGTSSSSLSFITPDLSEVVTLSECHQHFSRDLTAILLVRGDDGEKVTVQDFGRSAMKTHNRLSPDQRKQHIYFEFFKMELRKNVTLKTVVRDSQMKPYYLVEVVAFVLKYFKDRLHEYFETAMLQAPCGRCLCCTDFQWVVTVPAIWDEPSKEMMLKASLKAGLCSNKVEGIDFLSPPGNLLCVDFGCEKELQIVLEPECAAIYCQNMKKTHRASYSDDLSENQACYMIVDIGGGTVDTAIHQVSHQNFLDSVTPPIGNDFGGCRVNEKFLSFLSEIVKDENFEKFKAEKEAAAIGVISKIIYEEFEDMKITFGTKSYRGYKSTDNYIYIELDYKFIQFYGPERIKNGIKKLNDKRLYLSDNVITMSYSYLLDFIEDILNGIWNCVKKAIEQANCQIDTVYLVGGFGGSRLISEILKERVKESFPLMKSTKFVVPLKHDLAVSQGAVLYARDPSKIRSRVMNAHYGISMCIPFNPSEHNEHYKTTDEDGEELCDFVFYVLALKRQKVSLNEVFTVNIIPATSSQTCNNVAFYRTTRNDAYYTHDKNGKLVVERLGFLKIEFPAISMQTLKRKERKAKVEVTFSGTKIKAKGTFLPTGQDTKVELNCL